MLTIRSVVLLTLVWGTAFGCSDRDEEGTGGSGGSGASVSSGGSTSSKGGAKSSQGGGEDGGSGDGTEAGASGDSGGSSSGGTSSDTGGTSSGTGGSVGTGGTDPIGTDLCGGAGCACSNGIDDDGDGLVDGFDPECTGPYDDDEGTFATGISGDNKDPKWQDCFFDGNSGAGDDGCRYHTDCLYGKLDQDHASCQVTQACVEFCRARTPNGCDCFGCCSVRTDDGETIDVYTAPDCSLDAIDDEEKCPRCTKSTLCDNPCGECELCPGKEVEDLPEHCGSGNDPGDPGAGGAGGQSGDPGDPGAGGDPGDTPPPYTCDNGATVCTEQADCPSGGWYCHLGCCIVIVE